MLGAYRKVDAFAYPGWRITVPGGPAGGHYKGFTHNYSAGTALEPNDEYEADRGAGASSHDAVHATPRNPRGVYRSSGEVPPRPNASGSAHVYTGRQTQRHAGTSVAPGSFPAPFFESDEDSFLAGLGLLPAMQDRSDALLLDPRVSSIWRMVGGRVPPNTVAATPTAPIRIINEAPPTSAPVSLSVAPATGATSVVNQPPPVINPPAPAVSNVPAAPPISPTPSPVVASPVVVPDGSGNYIRVSDGSIVAPSSVYQNPATGQFQTTAASTAVPTSFASIESWLTQSSIWSAVPNWALLAGAGLLLFAGKGGRR